ncbi:MAG: glycosyltransferase [Acidobacteria bacterium]|nr:glycosyltransferase [Acidobacteriota bacterium]
MPAYNEAASLGAVLRAIDAAGRGSGINLRMIVVNDGSSDATGLVARNHEGLFPVTLIEHTQNRGLGAAIRTGLLAAVDLASDDDIVVTMDADDTHTPLAIAQMVERINAGEDVVIASRYRPGSAVIGVPWHRRLLSCAGSMLFCIFFPTRGVRDFTCGYRAYRASVLRRAVSRYREEFVNQEGFQCMVDILLKLRRMDLRFGEVPLTLRYDRKEGKSKMKIGRTILSTLGLMARRRIGL